MILDLAKLFNVKEGDMFNIISSNLPDEYKYTDFVIRNNELFILINGKEVPSILRLNDINWTDFSTKKSSTCKKIELTKNELYILKLIYNNTELKYLTKDDEEIWLFKEKPLLRKEFGKLFWDVENSTPDTICSDGNLLLNIFKSLPNHTCIKIDDYVDEFINLNICDLSFTSNVQPLDMEIRYL